MKILFLIILILGILGFFIFLRTRMLRPQEPDINKRFKAWLGIIVLTPVSYFLIFKGDALERLGGYAALVLALLALIEEMTKVIGSFFKAPKK